MKIGLYVPALRELLAGYEASLRPLRELMATDSGNIGAIETDVPRRPSAYLDLHALFRDGGPRGDDPLEAARARLVELGLGDLLDPKAFGTLTPAEVAQRVEVAVGAKCNVRTYDFRMNEAFFLFAFACGHYEAFYDWNDQAWPARKLIALGRLLEWWRWRRLGLDQMAQREKEADGNRRRGGKTNADKAAKPKAIARHLAREILANRVKPMSERELADAVLGAWPKDADWRPKFPTVRRYLRDFVAKV